MIRRPPRSPLFPSTPLFRSPEQLEPILPLAAARDEWQKRYINEVLDRNGQNRTKTAKDLGVDPRSEEHTSELQSPCNLVCRLLLEKKKTSSLACLKTTQSAA